jgi:hypothetical protein
LIRTILVGALGLLILAAFGVWALATRTPPAQLATITPLPLLTGSATTAPAAALSRDAGVPSVTPPALALARAGGDPDAIALTATTVYFISGDQLARVPKRGGEVVVIARGPVLDKVVADDTGVYWINIQSIMALPRGSEHPLEVNPGEREYRGALALDDRWIYWDVEGVEPYLARAPKVRPGAAFALPDETWLVPLEHRTEVIGVDGDWVYGLTSAGLRAQNVLKLSKNNPRAAPVVMARGLELGGLPAIRGRSVYFSDAALGAIVRVDEVTGSRTVLAAGQVRPGSVLVDGRAVYWNDEEGLLRAPIAGGKAERIAREQRIWRIAQDQTDVYWLSDTSVARVSKSVASIP